MNGMAVRSSPAIRGGINNTSTVTNQLAAYTVVRA